MATLPKLDQKVLGLLNDKELNASTTTLNEVWTKFDNARDAYGSSRKYVENQDPSQSELIEFKIRMSDLPDQTDEITSIFADMILGGNILHYEPNSDVTDKQAEMITRIQRALLESKDFKGQLRDILNFFIKYPMAICKVQRETVTDYITKQIIVPNPSVNELLMMGFEQELIDSGRALVEYFSMQGYTYVAPVSQPQTGYEFESVCTETTPFTEEYLYIKCISPRIVAFSDFVRKNIDRQQSIHEYHYYSLDDLESCGFLNVELVSAEKGLNDTNLQQPSYSVGDNVTNGFVTSDDEFYPIVETWTNIPFHRWVQKGLVTEEELVDFARRYGFSQNEFNNVHQKWCIFHYKDKAILRIVPNYLLNKTQHPYELESYVMDESRLIGEGFMERLSSITANREGLFNLMLENAKWQAYNPIITGRASEIDEDVLDKLRKPNGYANIDKIDGLTIDDAIKFVDIKSISSDVFNILDRLEAQRDAVGVSKVLRGEGNARTATQDQINNTRGQTQVNDAFNRLANMIMRIMLKHLGAIFINFTSSKFVAIIGEDAELLTQKWTNPQDLLEKLKPVRDIKFTADQQKKAQALMGALNIGAPFLQPEQLINCFTMLLTYLGMTEEEISKITNTRGSLTSVQQEINAMSKDPMCNPEVRMEDPHEICIMMAMGAMTQIEQTCMAMGVPADIQNFISYIEKHQAMIQQIQMLAMQAQIMQGGSGEQGQQNNLQGKPKQEPKGDGKDDGFKNARQSGQDASPKDSGMMTNAGLTGTNSLPKMGA